MYRRGTCRRLVLPSVVHGSRDAHGSGSLQTLTLLSLVSSLTSDLLVDRRCRRQDQSGEGVGLQLARASLLMPCAKGTVWNGKPAKHGGTCILTSKRNMKKLGCRLGPIGSW